MAGEIGVRYATGATLFAQVRNSTHQIWNTAGVAFENYATANIADYDIALVEQGTASGFYVGNFPAAVAGVYSIEAFVRAGGAPAESDTAVGSTSAFYWSGTTAGAIPWNAAWDAEVQSECADALAAYGAATATNVSAVETDTQDIQSRLPAALTAGGRMDSDVWAFRGYELPAVIVGSGYGSNFGALFAAAVAPAAAIWNNSTRTLTALDEDSTTLDLDDTIRAALGLASANLDTQLAALLALIDTEVAAILAAVDTEIAAIKAKTDNLPASPAAVGSAMVLSASGLDAVLVESGITAGAGLTNDTGTQLTAVNARQALALAVSALAAVLAGAATTNVTVKPAGKPAGAARIDATVDASGNRSAVSLKVPD